MRAKFIFEGFEKDRAKQLTQSMDEFAQNRRITVYLEAEGVFNTSGDSEHEFVSPDNQGSKWNGIDNNFKKILDYGVEKWLWTEKIAKKYYDWIRSALMVR
jgi:hypothetical protein